LAGCGASGSSGTSHTLKGTFTLSGDAGSIFLPDGEGGSCIGDGGYSDITEGTDVALTSDGKTLAVASLGEGKDVGGWNCEFHYTLTDVPKRDFYKLEVGNRGDVQYSFDDLEKAGWTVSGGLS
jgi:hypothetical protein